MAVDPSVHTFLGRRGTSGSTRTFADHLNPAACTSRSSSKSQPLQAGQEAPKLSTVHPGRRVTPPGGGALTSTKRVSASRPASAASSRPAPAPVVAEVGKARASEVRHVLSEDSPTREVLLADLSGAMRVALVWKPRVNAAGVRLSSDLHLGGLWQTRARDEGIIQALGDHVAAPGYGARQVARMGPRSEDREEMVVDTKHLPVFRRFFLYAYTSRDEVADWASYDPELRIEERSGATTTVPVELAPSGAGSVMALSVHVLEDRLVLRREDEVGRRTRDLAASYGFDVEWDTSGRSTRA